MERRKPKPPMSETRMLQAPVHFELLKCLKVAAVQDDVSVPEMLNRILSEKFGRNDLLMYSPRRVVTA